MRTFQEDQKPTESLKDIAMNYGLKRHGLIQDNYLPVVGAGDPTLAKAGIYFVGEADEKTKLQAFRHSRNS